MLVRVVLGLSQIDSCFRYFPHHRDTINSRIRLLPTMIATTIVANGNRLKSKRPPV